MKFNEKLFRLFKSSWFHNFLVFHKRSSEISRQGGLDARNPNQGIRMFRHGSRSFSRHIVCRSEASAANHIV